MICGVVEAWYRAGLIFLGVGRIVEVFFGMGEEVDDLYARRKPFFKIFCMI